MKNMEIKLNPGIQEAGQGRGGEKKSRRGGYEIGDVLQREAEGWIYTYWIYTYWIYPWQMKAHLGKRVKSRNPNSAPPKKVLYLK